LASVNGQVLRCYAHNCLDCDDQPRDKTIADLIQLFEGN
jgi:hypothetical protein